MTMRLWMNIKHTREEWLFQLYSRTNTRPREFRAGNRDARTNAKISTVDINRNNQNWSLEKNLPSHGLTVAPFSREIYQTQNTKNWILSQKIQTSWATNLHEPAPSTERREDKKTLFISRDINTNEKQNPPSVYIYIY